MGKHSIERAQQRYNMELSYRDEMNIKNMIRNGRTLPLEQPANNENMHFAYVLYKNIPLKVLYSTWEDTGKVRGIVTTYPFDADEYNEITGKEIEDKIDIAKKFLKAHNYVVYKKGKSK